MLPSFKTLSLAARNGDIEHVRECLNAGVDQNEHPGMPHGLSPLMYASHYGHVEIVRLLAEHGANVDFSDGDSFTAVTIAGEQSHWEIVKVLAEFGADFTIANASGHGRSRLLKALALPQQKSPRRHRRNSRSAMNATVSDPLSRTRQSMGTSC